MKFWAKVELKGEENASELVLTFFKDFNPESSIVIRGKEAKVEIIFETPPMEIVETLGHCEISELNFGKPLKEYVENENVADEEVHVPAEKNIAIENFSKQEQQPKRKRGRPPVKKTETKKEVNTKTVTVSELEEIAKKATSFENFVKLVAEWLEMDKRQVFCENLMIAATEVDEVSWKELGKKLGSKGVVFTEWDRIWVGQKVAQTFKDNTVTILNFLKEVRQYKKYSFGKESSDIENKPEEKVSVVAEEISTESQKAPNKVNLECVHEALYFYFGQILKDLDKTQPIEDRVRYVLRSMGWENKSEENQMIFEITNTAVRLKEFDLDMVFAKANIQEESYLKVRMTFSKFINDFVSAYSKTINDFVKVHDAPDKKVKLLDFLKELQKVVMNEDEL